MMTTATSLLRFADLKERGIVRNWPTLNRWIAGEGFPPGRKLGPNTRVWTETEIETWVSQRPVVHATDAPRRAAAKVAAQRRAAAKLAEGRGKIPPCSGTADSANRTNEKAACHKRSGTDRGAPISID